MCRSVKVFNFLDDAYEMVVSFQSETGEDSIVLIIGKDSLSVSIPNEVYVYKTPAKIDMDRIRKLLQGVE